MANNTTRPIKIEILLSLAQGNSVLSTARKVGVCSRTVMCLRNRAQELSPGFDMAQVGDIVDDLMKLHRESGPRGPHRIGRIKLSKSARGPSAKAVQRMREHAKVWRERRLLCVEPCTPCM